MKRAVAFVLATAIAAPALAAPKANEAVEVQKKKAEEAFKAKQYAVALEIYVAALASNHDPALLYNIARCHHELGNYPEAYRYYTRFAVEAPVELRAKVPHLDEKIAFVAARTAILKITANVIGAIVTINGKPVGESGALEPVRVNAGQVTVEAARDGFVPDRRVLDVSGGATVAVRLNLVEKVPGGTLKVQSNVATAIVSIDDQPAGRVPLSLSVAAGPHTVTATADGYAPWKRTVTVDVGGVRTLDANLSRSSTSWWIWAGVGAVVVTGAIVTYALLTERSADSGSFGPGQVSAGLIRF